MTSTLFMIYSIIVPGLIGGCLWGFVAYGRAFWATRRLTYLLLSLSWLMGPWAFTVISLLGRDPLVRSHNLRDLMATFAPLVPFMSMVLVLAFRQRPSADLFEFRSPRDIMLFRPTLSPAAQQEGLFVPGARPPRPSPVVILALTLGLLGATWALLALIR
jgi:hypothetical protein